MQVRIACSCGQVVDVNAAASGPTATCPHCGRAMAVPVAPPELHPASQEQPVPPPLPAPPLPAPPLPAPPGGAKRLKGLAVASMVVGIVSCMPCCGMGCMFFGVFGFLGGLTAIGLGIPSTFGKTAGRAFGVTGVVTGIVAIIISLMPLGFFGLWRSGMMFRGGPTSGPSVIVKGPPGAEPAPPLLAADRITELLTGPLKLRRNRALAAAELQKALAAYPNHRGAPRQLYECVQAFRRHVAYAGSDQPAKAAHARMFREAREALLDGVLTQYERAGNLEHDEKWAEAKAAYSGLLRLVPQPEGEFARNVTEHVAYCRRQIAGKDKSEPTAPTRRRRKRR